MNNSIKLPTPCELINLTPVNPLISKCQIKVCWVGEQPNRNKSIITKEVARDLANSLPGSPIVGYYNEETKDFEQHNRIIDIKDGKFELKDTTRPYGFVDLNAKAWFQKFSDNGVEHEYLMTEGWLWTGQYPECQRIIDKGNNHSMELDDKIIDAHWTKDGNGKRQFFIINEGIISKLCVLGEEYEPCFEGSQITKVQFSFEDGFKEQLFSMISEIKNILNEGGASMLEDKTPVVEEPVVQDPVEVPAEPAPADPETEPVVETTPVEETVVEPTAEDVEFAEKTCPKCGKALDECECEDKEFAEKTCPECGKPVSECTCEEHKDDEDKKEKYNLEEIPEYIELSTKYSALEAEHAAIVAERDELLAFKNGVEKEKKLDMIKSFYMLSDEDKKDVIDNVDSYSLDDIEAKLSIICVRNKVSFASLDDDKKDDEPVVYNLNDSDYHEDVTPAWIKAVQNNRCENK